MYEFTSLVKRHMLKFLRDRTAVFFSFLSVIILLVLYFLFIGENFVSELRNPLYANLIDPGLIDYIKISNMMGGILVINTISLSLGIMGNVINDLEQRSLDAYLVTPVKRYKIIFSYYVAAIIVTAFFTIVMWGFTIIYLGILSGYWFPISTIFYTTILLIFFTFISSSLMIYLVTLLKSVSAFGALSGILGTVIGFTCGIYMPLVILSPAIQSAASALPFTHMTILLKNALLKEPMSLLTASLGTEDAVNQMKPYFGMNEIGLFGADVNMFWLMLGSSVIAGILLYLGYRNMSRKIKQ
ncbi:ABC transporter permease [Mariniplasma anaerobium]|uniref:ABC transporter permease n=1 Tax=Mariniplasma anaerobium TaxID=2735436 RepID=A0A7U9TIA5_9MOLU|nr:ABC transporter permease [Mariniplasma anaerobium]BCR36619.1 ABC transporter permease [Mariniplasma anaerobium]